MGFNCGIVGLPNVGKSTLFNALTATAAAQAANYPFCTIEPNVGRVAVPDARLDTLAGIGKSAKIIPTSLEFVDIAGLVRGASKGEGLGNQFLANIREVDAIIHVLRCFEDNDVTHVEGSIDPIRDAETVETELMLADLDSLEKRLIAAQKKARGGGQGIDRAGGADGADRGGAAGRPAGAHRGAGGAGGSGAAAATADHQAGAVCVQCRRSVGGNGECVFRPCRASGRRPKAPGCSSISAAIEAEVSQLAEADRAGVPGGAGAARQRARSGNSRRLCVAGVGQLFHRRAEGNAGLDDRGRHQGAAGGGGDP